MTAEPEPVFLGAFQPMYREDVLDRFIDISADLVSAQGEHVDTAAFTVWLEGTDPQTDALPDVIEPGTVTYTSAGRVDFQVTAPAAAGIYWLRAVFTVSDGQRITKTATFEVV